MTEITCKAKKWGSSIGIIIPKIIVEQQHIGEGEDIVVEIKKRPRAKDFFGLIQGWKPPQKLKDEARKGWE